MISFEDAKNFLEHELKSFGPKSHIAEAGMERSRYFYSLFGNPQENFRTIHIAGTSGKGTVAYMLTQLLVNHGLTIGTNTSPHVYDIRERCIINANLVPKREFTEAVAAIVPIIESMRTSEYGQPTYFEANNAIAASIFKRRAVDYAVIETGLGGLYDSTNIIARADKLAIITTLGFDHTEVLGNTLPEIASQKAGILPFNGHAVALRPTQADTEAVIAKTAQERSTNLEFIDVDQYVDGSNTATSNRFNYRSDTLSIPDIALAIPGEHQITNAVVALRALEFIAKRDGFIIRPESVRAAFTRLSIPGRMERVETNVGPCIFDGAHNPQKLGALLDSLQKSGQTGNVWLFALKSTKDAKAIMETLQPSVDTLVLTSFFTNQEGMAALQPMDPVQLADVARAAGIETIHVIEDDVSALKKAQELSVENKPVIVSGSFYLLGDLHERLKAYA